MIFVDHANILKNLEKLKRRIDWKRFEIYLTLGSHLVGKLMYLGMPKKLTKEKKRFLRSLEISNWVIQPRPVQESPSGEKKQKGVDVFMYKEIVELAEADAYDKALIVSGDADFIDAIRKLKELKKKFEVWSFRISLSRFLMEEAGKENIHYIDTILDEIEFKN